MIDQLHLVIIPKGDVSKWMTGQPVLAAQIEQILKVGKPDQLCCVDIMAVIV